MRGAFAKKMKCGGGGSGEKNMTGAVKDMTGGDFSEVILMFFPINIHI